MIDQAGITGVGEDAEEVVIPESVPVEEPVAMPESVQVTALT